MNNRIGNFGFLLGILGLYNPLAKKARSKKEKEKTMARNREVLRVEIKEILGSMDNMNTVITRYLT